MQASKSNKIINSFRENFLLCKSRDTQIITHNNHQMKDIHHCQTFIISIGLFRKYLKSYISTCHSLHHIKTHKMSIMNNVSRSFSNSVCKFENL